MQRRTSSNPHAFVVSLSSGISEIPFREPVDDSQVTFDLFLSNLARNIWDNTILDTIFYSILPSQIEFSQSNAENVTESTTTSTVHLLRYFIKSIVVLQNL